MERARPRTNAAARRRLLRVMGQAAVAALTASAVPVAARADGSTFVAPTEDEMQPVRIGVFGDSLADGIWAGLYRTLQRNQRFEVARHTEVSSGLARPDFFDWQAELDGILANETIDIAVLCFGLNDNQPVYYEGRRQFSFASEEWSAVYRERVADVLQSLTTADIPTFWVGLPTVRDSGFAEQMAFLNDIYQSQSLIADVTFIPTLALTGDADGAYSAYLQDDEGRNRLMRANDGVHFTGRGYEMIAKALLSVMAEKIPAFPVDGSANG